MRTKNLLSKLLPILVFGIAWSCAKPPSLVHSEGRTAAEVESQDQAPIGNPVREQTVTPPGPTANNPVIVSAPAPTPSSSVNPPVSAPTAAPAVAPVIVVKTPVPIPGACKANIEYTNDQSPGAKKFTQYVPDGKAAIDEAAGFVCSILYKTAAEAPAVKKIRLYVRLFKPNDLQGAAAYVIGAADGATEMHFSSAYLDGVKGDIKREIDGILIHESVHIWQNRSDSISWVTEGVADYVRASGGWYNAGTRNNNGGKYDGAYTQSGYFFGHLNEKYPGFGHKLNLAAKNWPGVSFFQSATGRDVNTLWSEYQASGTFSPTQVNWQPSTPALILGK